MIGFAFAHPQVFWGLLPSCLLILWACLWQGRRALPVASLKSFEKPEIFSHRTPLRFTVLSLAPLVYRLLMVTLIFVALARPQWGSQESLRRTLGLDIFLVIDTSGSMRGMDLSWDGERVDRLEVLKGVLRGFIAKRTDDRLGMVVFGSESFVQAPLTLDHKVLNYFMDQLEVGMVGEKTAIGDGLAAAVSRFKESKVEKPLVILLTDGENTAGRIEPLAAAQAAKVFGVKTYTIGLGTNTTVPMHVGGGMYQNVPVSIDEKLLKEIAELTGGRYFHAVTTEDLLAVYDTIDALEKSEIEVKAYEEREEWYPFVLLAAIGLAAIGLCGASTSWRRIP